MSLVSEQTVQPKTSDRGAALLKFTLELLKNRSESMRGRIPVSSVNSCSIF
jgi:hypothetical protein